jgi:outer membrane lipoprotein-sorting protein
VDEPSGQPLPTSTSNAPKNAAAGFKNLKVLDAIPANQLIPSMRFISDSLGVQCVYCHVEGHFDDDSKKPKQTARSMMRMMFAINQNHFEWTREVTCNSCHRGTLRPVDVPAVAGEISPTKADAAALPTDQPTADQIIDNFIRAVGGTAALEKISTRVATGKMQVDGKSFSVEFFDQTPDKELFIQHTPAGDSVTVLDGNSGWISVPGHPVRNIESFNLDAARADADLQFALHLALNIKEMFPELRVEYPETVEGREAYVVVGTRAGQASWKFFFDVQSGLLVRLVRYADSPLGLDPTQIDYGDYRAVDGVQTPFTRTVAHAGSRSTIHLDTIQQNVPIDKRKFMKPDDVSH